MNDQGNMIKAQELESLKRLLNFASTRPQEIEKQVLRCYIAKLSPEAIVTAIAFNRIDLDP